MWQERPSPVYLALGDSQGARGPFLTKDPGQFCVVFHTSVKGGRRKGPAGKPDVTQGWAHNSKCSIQ